VSKTKKRKRTHTGGSSSAARPLRKFLEEGLEEASRALIRCLKNDDELGVLRAFRKLGRLFKLRRALASLAAAVGRERSVPLYLTSAYFLREAYKSVTATRNESLIYVTGPEDGKGLFVLSRLVPFRLARASRGYASPEPSSQLDVLTKLDDGGQRLLATFHSHPGYGSGSTYPSGVDRSTQEQLERVGYVAIGAIFSRDGYVRFYSKNRPFRIAVSGKGCEQIGDHLFRISDATYKDRFARRIR